jgi:methylated-DNA-protein-cysteine methyltransferase-like protein
VTEFAARVREVVKALPRGDVVTYGEVAALAGKPGAARGVGAILAGGGDDGLPWWRVVNSKGRLVPGHEVEHAGRLRAEGVAVDDGFVRFSPVRRGRARATTRS